MARSALEVVTLYNLEVWNKGRIELVPELCAETMIRYDANSVTTLDLDEQIARIRHNYEELRPTFDPIVLAGGDEFVTLVWNVTGRDPNWKWCGIEVFRVVDGKIVEVWNGPYVDGRWVRAGALAVGVGGAALRPIPVMSADFDSDRARLVVPLDARSIGIWLAGVLGPGTEDASGLRFGWSDRPQRLELIHAEKGGSARAISDAQVERLDISWARSGMTNVTLDVAGTSAAGAGLDALEAPKTARLSECFGGFDGPNGTLTCVIGASIKFEPTARTVSGEVTLRIPQGVDPKSLCGSGRLQFGWQNGGAALHFEATAAHLVLAEGAFADAGETEAPYRWTADNVEAVLVCGD